MNTPSPIYIHSPDKWENQELQASSFHEQIFTEGDKLRIGVGNVEEEDYINEQGEQVHGWRVGLWLFFKDPAKGYDKNRDIIRVYPGQIIERHGYKLQVYYLDPVKEEINIRISHPTK